MRLSLDGQILCALRQAQAGTGSVSGGDLSQSLGISRAAIWARIEELRRLGYEIEASPHLGYRLLSVPDLLHGDDLQSRLHGRSRVIGRSIQVFHETTSTNDIVEKLARDGAEEGAVVFAESQTKGRGRLGRKWLSPTGKGLWFSILLRPELPPQAATQLTVIAATGVARAIRRQTSLKPAIKWPNDILLSGKKTAGILTELNAELDHIRYVIIGIGIDVNLTASDLPTELKPIATSLRIEQGAPLHRAELAAAVLEEIDADYARIRSGEFSAVADEWEAQCQTIGANVTIHIGDRQIQGRAEALAEDGALLLRTEHGHLERIVGGDVTLRKPGSKD